jgi:hypothetical protein
MRLALTLALAYAVTACGGPPDAPDLIELAACDVAAVEWYVAPAGSAYRVDILAPGYWVRDADNGGCADWVAPACLVFDPGVDVEVGAGRFNSGAPGEPVKGTLWPAGEAPGCAEPFDAAWLG